MRARSSERERALPLASNWSTIRPARPIVFSTSERVLLDDGVEVDVLLAVGQVEDVGQLLLAVVDPGEEADDEERRGRRRRATMATIW